MYRLKRRYGLGATRRPADRTGVTRSTATHSATGPNRSGVGTSPGCRPPSEGVTSICTSSSTSGAAASSAGSCTNAKARITPLPSSEASAWKPVSTPPAWSCTPTTASRCEARRCLPCCNGSESPHHLAVRTSATTTPTRNRFFGTMKQTPAYPSLPFASEGTARAWVSRFVAWYNAEHRHSGIRYVTPDQRHRGDDHYILARRAELYEAARRRRPHRWTRHARNWAPVLAVTLNPTLPRPANVG
jgi:hypothetical protein